MALPFTIDQFFEVIQRCNETVWRGKGHTITFIAPIVWSLVGVQAAFLFGVVPDLVLGVAGLIAISFAVSRPRTAKSVIGSRAWRPEAGTTARGRSG